MEPAPLPTLFPGYAPPAGAFDEVRGASGDVLPHWLRLGAYIADLGLAELGRRERAALRQLQENGASYNVHADPRGGDHPWQLDAVPLVLHDSEWNRLAEGLAQRAHLLNLLLADLYGAQRCLHEGVLPPEIVFDNPAYLRPCHGLTPPDGIHLHFYGVDLARGADGGWRVLGDLAQTPAGAGYVLENRIVLSRLLADHFRDSQVHRLAMFFQKFRETLFRLAPRHRDNPRIVMLSGGPGDETYFEHTFLARYLEHVLVEGEDLAVREQAAWLKMLGGLQPVDVIVRRVADFDCDPLELNGDSKTGLPGLLQAVRSGQVAVVNALGAGLVESPALLPFLPALCRFFLSEDLAIPSAPTLWCGDPTSMSVVLDDVDAYRVFEGVGARRAHADAGALRAAMLAEPHRFVAQEQVPGSVAPVLEGEELVARHVFLRTYLCADSDTYAVMPGGLARAVEKLDALHDAVAAGGVSKDVWVVSDEPVSEFSLLQSVSGEIALSRGGGDLPSRVADHLYWLGRYAERSDFMLRVIRCLLLRLSERPEGVELPHLARHAETLGLADTSLAGEQAYRGLEQATLSFLLDDRVAGGLRQTVDAVRRVAGVARDRLSADTWRMLNRMELNLEEMSFRRRANLGEVLEMIERMLIRLTAFSGTSMESMTRGQGWRFLDMGRRLERSACMLSLLRTMLVAVDPAEPILLEDLLDIADSSITYRRRYLTSLAAAPVLDLLLVDDTNPRSVLFQVDALAKHVDGLPRDAAQVGLAEDQRLVTEMITTLRLANIVAVTARDPAAPRREALDALLGALSDRVADLSDSLTRLYLSHARPARQLDTIRLTGHAIPRPTPDDLPVR